MEEPLFREGLRRTCAKGSSAHNLPIPVDEKSLLRAIQEVEERVRANAKMKPIAGGQMLKSGAVTALLASAGVATDKAVPASPAPASIAASTNAKDRLIMVAPPLPRCTQRDPEVTLSVRPEACPWSLVAHRTP